jgi:hypothetical protein
MGARLGRVLLVVALLVAQQSAFAHQVWHLAKTGGAAAAIAAPEQQPPQSRADRLCDFHSALATVLGAVSAATPSALPAAALYMTFVSSALPAFSIAAPLPASRGPPLFRL